MEGLKSPFGVFFLFEGEVLKGISKEEIKSSGNKSSTGSRSMVLLVGSS